MNIFYLLSDGLDLSQLGPQPIQYLIKGSEITLTVGYGGSNQAQKQARIKTGNGTVAYEHQKQTYDNQHLFPMR